MEKELIICTYTLGGGNNLTHISMKSILTVASLLLVGVIIWLAISSPNISQEKEVKAQKDENVVRMEDGIQVIYITSTTGGYSPRTVTADANIQTILRMSSENSYGCERSFRIPSMNINEVLPAEGETDFDLGTPKNGEEVFGSCSMGMYTFTINFE
jgi:plastocyanin domain-containing protein